MTWSSSASAAMIGRSRSAAARSLALPSASRSTRVSRSAWKGHSPMIAARRRSTSSPPSRPRSARKARSASSSESYWATQRRTRSRPSMNSFIARSTMKSLAAASAACSAFPSGPFGALAALASAFLRALTANASASRWSSTSKWPATFASKGNWWRRRSQKAWMVWILRPPGVSSALAKRRRASARVRASGRWPSSAAIALASFASGSAVHAPRISKTRFAISAAAARVKVRQRMRPGSAPASNRRITR